MAQIFISYSRKDLVTAERIIDALATDDLAPWIDWQSIPKGEQFWTEIQRGIESSDVFLFLVSPHSVTSEWCSREIAHAAKNGKRILPLVVCDPDGKHIHPEISKRNWIFCRDGQDDFNKAIVETRKTIHTDYEWLKYHTELQVKAVRWKQHNDASRLLRGKELRDAEARIVNAGAQTEPQPTKLQRQFVTASRSAENDQIETELKLAQTLAEEQRKRAEEQERLRLGNLSIVLASQSVSLLDIYQEPSERGPLLALQAYDFHRKYQGFMVSIIDKALRKSLGYWRYSPRYNANTASKKQPAAMDRETAFESTAGTDPAGTESPFPDPTGMFDAGNEEFLSIAYSRDSQYLAIARSSGVIELWLADMFNPTAASISTAYANPLTRIPASGGNVLSMSFRDGGLLGVLRDDNSLTIYRVEGRTSSELARSLLPPLEFEKPDIPSYFTIAIYRKMARPIVFCPDRKTIVAANRNVAYVWNYDARDLKPAPLTMPNIEVTDRFNDAQIMDLIYSPNDEIVVLWSEGVVAWYSGSSLELIAQIRLAHWAPFYSYGYGHTYRYANAILSSTGSWIASCGMSGDRPPTTTLYVWRIPETHPTGSEDLPPHYSETLDPGRFGLDIAFSQDEQYLACWVSGGFRIWHVNLLEALKSRNESYALQNMSSPDVEPADVVKDVEVFSKDDQQGSVLISDHRGLIFSRDNSVLFCQSRESIVTGYLDPNPELSSLVVLNLQPLTTIPVGIDGREVTAAELEQDPGLKVTLVRRNPVRDLRFTPDGSYLLILDAIDRLHIRKLNDFRGVPETKDLRAVGKERTSRSYRRIADLGAGQFAVFGDPGSNDRGEMPVILFDKRKEPMQAVAFHLRMKDTGRHNRPENIVMTNRSVRSVLEDGMLLTCQTSRNRVISRKRKKFLEARDPWWGNKDYFAEFDHKGKVYIQASSEREGPFYSSRNLTYMNQICWRMTASAKGKLRETRLADRSRMMTFTIAEDGTKSACGHENGVISITQFPPGKPAISYELISGQRSISALAISADGNLLASSGGDKNIKIWDLIHPKQAPIVLTNPGDLITRLAFSSDNQILASVDQQGMVRLWIVQLDHLAQALKKLVTRKLSESEWTEFVGEDIPYEPVS